MCLICQLKFRIVWLQPVGQFFGQANGGLYTLSHLPLAGETDTGSIGFAGLQSHLQINDELGSVGHPMTRAKHLSRVPEGYHFV